MRCRDSQRFGASPNGAFARIKKLQAADCRLCDSLDTRKIQGRPLRCTVYLVEDVISRETLEFSACTLGVYSKRAQSTTRRTCADQSVSSHAPLSSLYPYTSVGGTSKGGWSRVLGWIKTAFGRRFSSRQKRANIK